MIPEDISATGLIIAWVLGGVLIVAFCAVVALVAEAMRIRRRARMKRLDIMFNGERIEDRPR